MFRKKEYQKSSITNNKTSDIAINDLQKRDHSIPSIQLRQYSENSNTQLLTSRQNSNTINQSDQSDFAEDYFYSIFKNELINRVLNRLTNFLMQHISLFNLLSCLINFISIILFFSLLILLRSKIDYSFLYCFFVLNIFIILIRNLSIINSYLTIVKMCNIVLIFTDLFLFISFNIYYLIFYFVKIDLIKFFTLLAVISSILIFHIPLKNKYLWITKKLVCTFIFIGCFITFSCISGLNYEVVLYFLCLAVNCILNFLSYLSCEHALFFGDNVFFSFLFGMYYYNVNIYISENVLNK